MSLRAKTRSVELDDQDAACLWIIDNQKGRRNVSDIDKIALQAAREEIVSRKAKANQKAAGNPLGKSKSASGKIAKSTPVNTRAECAKAADVGERTYDAGKLILAAVANGTVKPEVLRRYVEKLELVAWSRQLGGTAIVEERKERAGQWLRPA